MRARRRRSIVRLLSWLLLAGGAYFLVLGAREFLAPILGQREIARTWKPAGNEKPATANPQPPAAPELGDAVCRLMIPRLGAHLFVVEGTDKHDLRIGPGHMEGSALPGAAGNCIIAGHRDTHFRVLKDLRKGDDIVLETRSGEFRYRVESLKVVSPRDTKPLQPTAGAVLHLITCYPFYYVGSAPKRFVVKAELEGASPSAAKAEPSKPGPAAAAIRAPEPSAAPSHPARHKNSIARRAARARHRTVARRRKGPISRLVGRIFGHRTHVESDPIVE